MTNAPAILIVEQTEDLRELVSEALTSEGLQICAAASAAEAIPLLRARDFSVVLANLFGRDDTERWAAAEELLAHARPVPVGLLSGWKVDAEEVRRRGFAFVLSKPFDVESMLATLAAYCQIESVDEERRTAITTYFDSLTQQDWSRLGSLCAPDVIYHLPGEAPLSATVAGREAFAQYAQRTFSQFPNARFDVQALVPLQSGVVARYLGRWDDSGQQRTLPGAVLFRFSDGTPQIREVGVRLELRKLIEAASEQR